jgi:RNA polymerase sigma factor (sigma-70 family)
MAESLHSALNASSIGLPAWLRLPRSSPEHDAGRAMLADTPGADGSAPRDDRPHMPSPWTGEEDDGALPDGHAQMSPEEQRRARAENARDLALARACIRGEESAWREFMDTYRDQLRSIAWHYNCPEHFDDLFSDFVIKLLGSIDGTPGVLIAYDASVKLSTYLAVVFRHMVVDFVRYHSRRAATHAQVFRESAAAYADPKVTPSSELAAQADLSDVICSVVENLPPAQRRVVELYYFQELTMEETAAILNCSKSRISRQLKSIYSVLRRRLAAVDINAETL